MAHTFHRYLLILPIFAVIIGCASSKLNLELAIYKEDPLSQLHAASVDDVDNMLGALDKIGKEITLVGTARIGLAQELYDVYRQFYSLSTKARNPKYTDQQIEQDLTKLKVYLSKFKRQIAVLQENALSSKKTVDLFLGKYRELLAVGELEAAPVAIGKAQQNALLAVSDFRISLERLSGPSGTDFEKYITGSWTSVAAAASPKNVRQWYKGDLREFQALDTKISALSGKISQIEQQGLRVSDKLANSVNRFEAAGIAPSVLVEASTSVSESLREMELDSSVSFSSTAEDDVRRQLELTQLLATQIERLQNPADPVWRIVSDPDNQDKWNAEFKTTYYYAEGDSSVVVVRDTVTDFRVQQGSNNPAALVQAQLQVSRAIGDAAISVAGAATGIDLTPVKQPDAESTPNGDKDTTDAESIARSRATLKREAELRGLAINTLASDLRLIRDALQKLGNNATNTAARKALLMQLAATLKANEGRFGQSN